MKEKIYTVPISEAFERPDEGCPLCFLRRNLEEASLRYILGDAMMEPSVRLETNARGFCARHLARMLERPARLSLALMLESLYAHLEETGGKNLPALEAGCYVCDRIALFMEHFRRNIVWMWQTEPDFAHRLTGRCLCLSHAAQQLETARKLLGRRTLADFSGAILSPVNRRTAELHGHLSAFCTSFDHRQAGQPLDAETKTAVERAAVFLGGEQT